MSQRRVSYLFLGLTALLLAGTAARMVLRGTGACMGASLAGTPHAVARAASVAARAIVREVLPAVATAQEALDFKPVPRESVSRFERMRVHRHPRALEDSLPPEPPSPPEPAEPPSIPTPPVGIVDRSGSIMRIGSDIHVGKDEVIEGDLSSVSGDITIEGHVEGDVVAMKGDVELKSTARVDGDVVCLGGTLTEEPGAEVGGQKVTAPVHGFWRDHAMNQRVHSHDSGEHVASALVWLLVMLFFAWMFARFLEGRTLAALDTLRREPGLSLGIGSLVWALIIPSIIALALVVALLCITIIGIPLALAALVGYVLFLAVLAVWGFTVGAAFLGGGLSKRPQPAVPVATAPLDLSPPPTLMRTVLLGVTALSGAVVAGRLVQTIGDIGPLHGLGTLVVVLSIMASFVAMTVGAGALMRTEIVNGTFQRLVFRRRPAPPPPAAPVTPDAGVAPPPPPSPPSAFQPPAASSPPPPSA